QPAVRGEVRRVQPDADARSRRSVHQSRGEVPVGDSVRRQWESNSREALMPAGISTSDFYYILPELVLTAGALVVLIADVLLPRERRSALSWVTLAAIGATLASLLPFTSTHVEVAHGLLAVDRFALFFKIVFLVAPAITVL